MSEREGGVDGGERKERGREKGRRAGEGKEGGRREREREEKRKERGSRERRERVRKREKREKQNFSFFYSDPFDIILFVLCVFFDWGRDWRKRER